MLETKRTGTTLARCCSPARPSSTPVPPGIAINERLSVQLAILNGGTTIRTTTPTRPSAARSPWPSRSKTNFYFNTYIGNEGATGTDALIFLDFVALQSIGDTLSLSLNADYFKLGSANWSGVGLKAKIVLTENFYLVPRVEFVSSKAGGYGRPGFGLPPTQGDWSPRHDSPLRGRPDRGLPIPKNYEIRAEVRGDFSDKEHFAKGTDPKKNQFTGLLGFLAWLP